MTAASEIRRLPPPMRPERDPVSAATWTRRRQLASNLRGVSGRAYPRIIGLLREPSWVFFEVLIPFMTTSAFVFVYRALGAPPEYVGFAVLGGAKVSIDARVEPDILGGLVVKVGSRLFDSSIRSKLQRLQLAMKGVA